MESDMFLNLELVKDGFDARLEMCDTESRRAEVDTQARGSSRAPNGGRAGGLFC